jgi:hypothetical protein
MIRVRGSVEGFKALLAGDDGRPREVPPAVGESRGVPATGPVSGQEVRHAG